MVNLGGGRWCAMGGGTFNLTLKELVSHSLLNLIFNSFVNQMVQNSFLPIKQFWNILLSLASVILHLRPLGRSLIRVRKGWRGIWKHVRNSRTSKLKSLEWFHKDNWIKARTLIKKLAHRINSKQNRVICFWRGNKKMGCFWNFSRWWTFGVKTRFSLVLFYLLL